MTRDRKQRDVNDSDDDVGLTKPAQRIESTSSVVFDDENTNTNCDYSSSDDDDDDNDDDDNDDS